MSLSLDFESIEKQNFSNVIKSNYRELKAIGEGKRAGDFFTTRRIKSLRDYGVFDESYRATLTYRTIEALREVEK